MIYETENEHKIIEQEILKLTIDAKEISFNVLMEIKKLDLKNAQSSFLISEVAKNLIAVCIVTLPDEKVDDFMSMLIAESRVLSMKIEKDIQKINGE